VQGIVHGRDLLSRLLLQRWVRAGRKYPASAEERRNLIFYLERAMVAKDDPGNIEYLDEFRREVVVRAVACSP
jgi:hypothetical protein